ncbi:MAG: DUF4176 domain-containing protein [Clostridium sp.]|nr:DUF4176 domain-containing protein [Clostridium sp.]
MQEGLLRLISDYLEDVDFLEQSQKEMLMHLAEDKDIISFLYGCMECIKGVKHAVEIAEKKIAFSVEEKSRLVWEDKEIIMNNEHARELCSKMIDVLEPVYPLGTVVELTDSFTQSLRLKNQGKRIRVVIVERFAATSDKQAFFPYVGVIYPVGLLGKGRYLHFTSSLIDNVLHEGFKDEMDDAYVLLMKKELLIDNDAVSFGMLSKEEAALYETELGVKRNAKEGN